MGLSNEWTEWHLTGSGWIRGSCKTDFALDRKLPPSNRILTIIYKERISSSFSNINANIHEDWNCGDSYKIKDMLQKFGACPSTL